MYILIESPSISENVFEYDVFKEEHEIDYGNILFHAKVYCLKSLSPRFNDSLDIYMEKITPLGIEALKKDVGYYIFKKIMKSELLDCFPIEENNINIKKVNTDDTDFKY